MSHIRINILQIGTGEDNWQGDLPERSDLKWTYLASAELETYLGALTESAGSLERYTGVVITSIAGIADPSCLKTLAEPYSYLVDRTVITRVPDLRPLWQYLSPWLFHANQRLQVIDHLVRYFFDGQYGERRQMSSLILAEDMRPLARYQGNVSLTLAGDFGQDWRLIGSFRQGQMYEAGMPLDFWQEYLQEGSVQLMMELTFVANDGGIRSVKRYLLEGSQQVHNDYDEYGLIMISLYIRGAGTLVLKQFHMRYSRLGYGMYILGGKRLVDRQGEELAVYFHPGNLKPPLNVYFSGFRTAEGFEGMWMMKGFDHPFILVTDPRLEGGAFYRGSAELERLVLDFIQDKLDLLHFNNKQLVLAGLSMGTYGALYYGASLNPHTIILGTPIVSMGQVATNMRTHRPDEFQTSLDIVMKLQGQVSEASSHRLDQSTYDHLRTGAWAETNILVVYMTDDDYDHDGYARILDLTSQQAVKVVGKSIPGRHTDNLSVRNNFFVQLFRQWLAQEFGGNDD